MKKFIIPALLFAAVMTTSCGSDAVKASDAKEVTKQDATATYSTISETSKVEWKAWHWGKLEPRFGKVTVSEATVSTKNNELVNGKFTINISSLTVENFSEADSVKTNDLTGHLKSDHFFLTDSFPTATFEITSVDTISGDFNTVINGNMTLKDVTKNVTFKANILATEDAFSIVSETFEINRLDWGLKYKEFNNAIHNNIAFTINIQLEK